MDLVEAASSATCDKILLLVKHGEDEPGGGVDGTVKRERTVIPV
jgi:hypothetical protein